MKSDECIFCKLSTGPHVMENDFFYGNFDKYPVTEGHLLVIPKRHIETLFELTAAERTALLELIEQSKDFLQKTYHPDGFNFGVNQGEAAGQTIPHLHLHIIPRYFGDLKDPEGGVRGVIPEKQKYRR
ncbi:MAG: HIT family protein [Clostridiaceae bacterium]